MSSCPQCGCDTDGLTEGVCVDCFSANQLALDLHNAEYDHWNSLTERQKDEAIAKAK
jgi:hypothetical protein